MLRRTRALLALCAIASALHVAASITFDLGYGQQKCFTEDLPPVTIVRGDVHIASGKGEMRLDLFVTNQQGVLAFHKSDVNAVKFSFQTGAYDRHTTQLYRFCVVNQVHGLSGMPPGDVFRRVTMQIDVMSASRGNAVGGLATRDHVTKLQQSFHEVSGEVDRLIESLDELRAKEQQLTDVNANTSTMIVRISIIACLFTILTGVLNVMSLKSFFKQKKLA